MSQKQQQLSTSCGTSSFKDQNALSTLPLPVSHNGFAGPWNLLVKNSILKNTDGTAHKCEDPYIWRSKRGWHLLVHNQEGPQVRCYIYYILM